MVKESTLRGCIAFRRVFEESNVEADEWTQRQEDQLRVRLHRAVYRSLYRPLKPCHFASFWHQSPHLRELLTAQR